jgi:NO-binding membrane sensor protein with MHYT domain
MHYLGQASTANYICIYDIGNILGAVLVAVVATTAALGTFFLWRSQWSTSQLKRAFCAAILALAVSGYGSVYLNNSLFLTMMQNALDRFCWNTISYERGVPTQNE